MSPEKVIRGASSMSLPYFWAAAIAIAGFWEACEILQMAKGIGITEFNLRLLVIDALVVFTAIFAAAVTLILVDIGRSVRRGQP